MIGVDPVDAAPVDMFVHEALYYRDEREFLSGTLGFVRSGLDAGEPVLIAVPEPRLDLLRGELAGVDQVRLVDMAQVGRNPNRILPLVLRAFVAEHEGRRVRIVGEPIYVGRTPDEIGPCVQHEALINVAFAGYDGAILCPYDVAGLPDVIEWADRTHPTIVAGGSPRHSVGYVDPYSVVAMFNLPLPEPARVDATLIFDAEGWAAVRRLVATWGEAAGLSTESVQDLQLAASEIGTNALTHAAVSEGLLRVWSDGDRIVCEIQGAGQLSDPMAGRSLPSMESAHGRGLLIANRLCDLVQTYTRPTGTVTRLHMWLSGT